MGGRLPILKPRGLIAVLERLGSRERLLGATSHRRYVHPDGRRTTVPHHSGQDVSRGLLRKVLKDISLTADELHRPL